MCREISWPTIVQRSSLGSIRLHCSTRVSNLQIKLFPVSSEPRFERCFPVKICCLAAHHSLASFITSLPKTKYLIQLQALNLVSQRGGSYLLLENGTFISLSKSKISTVTLTYPVLLSGSQFVQWFLICPYFISNSSFPTYKGRGSVIIYEHWTPILYFLINVFTRALQKKLLPF